MANISITLVTGLFWAWLWFMIAQPKKWEALVDWENDYFLKRGLHSAAASEKYKKLQKGWVFKALVAATALIGTAAMAMVIYVTRNV